MITGLVTQWPFDSESSTQTITGRLQILLYLLCLWTESIPVVSTSPLRINLNSFFLWSMPLQQRHPATNTFCLPSVTVNGSRTLASPTFTHKNGANAYCHQGIQHTTAKYFKHKTQTFEVQYHDNFCKKLRYRRWTTRWAVSWKLFITVQKSHLKTPATA